MDNYQGDLTDIIRATGGGGGGGAAAAGSSTLCDDQGMLSDTVDWEFSANPINNYHGGGIEENTDEFGDPFSNRRDPLLLLLQDPPAGIMPSCSRARGGGGGSSSSSVIFSNNPSGVVASTDAIKASMETTTDCFGDRGLIAYDDLRLHNKKITENEDEDGGDCDDQERQRMKSITAGSRSCATRPPANIFSSMLQISPTSPSSSQMTTTAVAASPLPPGRGIKICPLIIPNDHQMLGPQNHFHNNNLINNNNNNCKSSCLIENIGGGAVQISSPRNAGIKRRKSQAKKVVCIPAPAPVNSRPSSGEVVPSDLWAWRKYGQKPIKGSPYPRGYYRCSSSKGCSARKQVERSRTDPNMLVITYTSEHNHPWPTQRNALAGSTRAQPATKGGNHHVNNNSSSNTSSSKTKEKAAATSNCFLKEDDGDRYTRTTSHHDDGIETQAVVKEEMVEEHGDPKNEDHTNNYNEGISVDDQVMSELGFPLESYRPDHMLPADQSSSSYASSTKNSDINIPHHQQDFFFTGLGDQMETDPLNLLFKHGFSGMVVHQEEPDQLEVRESTNVVKPNSDPFTGLFHWAASASTSGRGDDAIASNKSFGDQAKSSKS